MTKSPNAIVRGAAAEQVSDGPASTLQLLVDGEHTGGAVTVNRSHLAPGSMGAPAHRHHHASETIFVIDGSLDVLVDDEVHTLTAGDLVHLEPGTAHAFGPTRGHHADMLAYFTPGQERFHYYRMLEQLHLGEITLAELQSTSGRFDNHYVDSPAWRANRG